MSWEPEVEDGWGDDPEFDYGEPDYSDAAADSAADDVDLIECRECGEETWEDAPQCSNCGCWFSQEDRTAPQAKMGFSAILLVIILCVAMLLL